MASTSSQADTIAQMGEFITMLNNKVMALKNAKTTAGKTSRIKLTDAPTLRGLQDQGREAAGWINAAQRYVGAIGGAGDGEVAYALTSKFVDFARIWFDCGYGDSPADWDTPEKVIGKVREEFVSANV